MVVGHVPAQYVVGHRMWSGASSATDSLKPLARELAWVRSAASARGPTYVSPACPKSS